METRLFRRFQELAYEQAGIDIRPGKEALISARVGKRMRALQLPNHQSYLSYLENDGGEAEMVLFLDAITTNHTSFFREDGHFKLFAEVLQQRWRQGQRRFRVWCAAASTGEEPYTLAMTALQALPERDADLRILCTDLSTGALAAAKAGVYPERVVQSVPRRLRAKYMQKETRGSEVVYRMTEAARAPLVFARLNLARPPFPMRGPFDFVFCRNVMIYFDDPVRERLIADIERLLAPDGILCIGFSETLTSIRTNLCGVGTAAYQKRES